MRCLLPKSILLVVPLAALPYLFQAGDAASQFAGT